VAAYTQQVEPRPFDAMSFAGLVANARVSTVSAPLRVKVR